jgi:hypothetical protein
MAMDDTHSGDTRSDNYTLWYREPDGTPRSVVMDKQTGDRIGMQSYGLDPDMTTFNPDEYIDNPDNAVDQ